MDESKPLLWTAAVNPAGSLPKEYGERDRFSWRVRTTPHSMKLSPIILGEGTRNISHLSEKNSMNFPFSS